MYPGAIVRLQEGKPMIAIPTPGDVFGIVETAYNVALRRALESIVEQIKAYKPDDNPGKRRITVRIQYKRSTYDLLQLKNPIVRIMHDAGWFAELDADCERIHLSPIN